MPRVLVPLAEGFEEMEAVTVVDILRRAGMDVVTAGLLPGPVRASRGTVILPDASLDAVLDQAFDLVVLPGGQPGAAHLGGDPRIADLLRNRARRGEITAAICAAPGVLAAHGLLDGKTATAFPGTLDPAAQAYRLTEAPVVVDGNIVTSRGPGTALDFALTLVELLLGPGQRAMVEEPLQRPKPSNSVKALPSMSRYG